MSPTSYQLLYPAMCSLFKCFVIIYHDAGKSKSFLYFFKKFFCELFCFFRVFVFWQYSGGKGLVSVRLCLSAARDLNGCCENFVLPFADLFEVKFGRGAFQHL